MHARILIAATAALLAGCNTTIADPLTPVELPGVDRLDDSAVSYLYRMGWTEREKALAGTTSLAVSTDPAVQAVWGDIKRVAARPTAEDRLLNLALHTLTLDTVMAAVPAGGERPRYKHVLWATAGTPESAAKLQAAWDAAVPPVPAGAPEPARIDGMDVHPYNRWAGGSLYVGVDKGKLLYLMTPQEQAPTTAGTGEGKLADEAQFKTVADKLLEGTSGKPIAFFYHDLRPTWKRRSAGRGAAVWDAMSWRSLDAAAGATFVDPDTKLLRNRQYWKIGEKRTGLFQFTQTGRVSEDWLKRVPADASGFIAGHGDMYSWVLSMACLGMEAVGGGDDDAFASGAGQMAMLQPVMHNLGPRYLIYRRPRAYGQMPLANALPLSNTVIVVQAGNPGGFVAAVNGLLTGMTGMPAGQPVKHKIAGVSVTAMNLGYFSFYFAELDGALMITTDPQLIKDEVRNWQKPGPSLVDSADYKAAAKFLQKDACFQLYIRPGGLATGYYDTYLPMAQQAMGLMTAMVGRGQPAPASRGLDMFLVPRGRDIARHVKHGTIMSAVDDGQGVLFDGRAPVLRSAYYWTYLYELMRLGPGRGMETMVSGVQRLLMPAEPQPNP